MDGKGGDAQDRDRHRDGDDGADSGEKAPRQRAARFTRLGREVRDGLETGEREHGQRQREGDRVPGRSGAEVDAFRESAQREQIRETEDDEEQVRGEGEPRDQDGRPVQTRPPDQPHGRHAEDDDDADDDVPGVVREAFPADRMAEVVRDEEPRQSHHDQVVEEERPTGDEPERIVERAADEGCRAAGLGNRGRALRVREGHEQEQEADHEQHPRREPQGEEGDDAESEVERGGDLPVGDRCQRRDIEDALEDWELSRHYCSFRLRCR